MSDPFATIIDDIHAKAGNDTRIVFMSGDFNVIHPGHLRIINFAAECGEFLVVAVNGEGRGLTVLPEKARCEAVSALSAVGYAFVLKAPVTEFIARLRPAVVVKGSEHHGRHNVEKDVVNAYGGRLLFSSGDAHYSYIDLLQDQLAKSQPSFSRLNGYGLRHNFTAADLGKLVQRFAGLRVAVIGDLIVDEYTDCEALGMSREDPTLVVSPILTNRFVGGAGIVAAHVRALGAEVKLFSVVGQDAAANFARQQLKAYGVNASLLADDTRPSTLKQRFRAEGKTLLRVSHLRSHAISDELTDMLATQVEKALESGHLLIFSDFNYGCLPQVLVDRITAFCTRRNIVTAADSQASSQLANVARFSSMNLLTPTEHEARLSMQDSQSGLVVLAESLRRKSRAQHVILTLGSEGVVIHSPSAEGSLPDDRLPALNDRPRDVSGAGDCLLAATALSLAAGADIWQSAYLGSMAAACQVGRLGNLPLDAEELLMVMGL
jgi:rfaE bifunctional protein kinase chain/domain